MKIYDDNNFDIDKYIKYEYDPNTKKFRAMLSHDSDYIEGYIRNNITRWFICTTQARCSLLDILEEQRAKEYEIFGIEL